ncbi:hypothetical protein HOY82DRAFT_598262 [Tuber indicum]|nr:hypothetical protein HOY82DRAFT_598262 [Tuber indicum]
MSAIPIAKNRFRPDKGPLRLEDTAIHEPALVSNQSAEDEVVDRIYNHEAQHLHSVASTIAARFNASGNAKAEREPYEVEDIAPTEKRSLVQPTPFIPEEEEQEAQAQLGGPTVRRNPDTMSKEMYCSEDWQRVWESSQNERPEEVWANNPHREHISEPIPAAKPHEPISDRFDGHVEVPITLNNIIAVEDVDGVDTHAYLLNRFKTVPTTIGDTPDYAVPAHLLPETLLDTEEEDPEEYLERRAMYRLAIPDIKADEPVPATDPEAGPAEPEVRLLQQRLLSPPVPPILPQQGIGIPRPAIQN